MESEAPKKLPVLVRLVAILLYVGAIFALIRAIVFMVNPAFKALSPYVRMSIPGSYVIGAVINTIFARGLLRRKNWARILVTISYGLATLLAIARGVHARSLGLVVIGLVSFLIFYYLLTNKSVRWAFKK